MLKVISPVSEVAQASLVTVLVIFTSGVKLSYTSTLFSLIQPLASLT